MIQCSEILRFNGSVDPYKLFTSSPCYSPEVPVIKFSACFLQCTKF